MDAHSQKKEEKLQKKKKARYSDKFLVAATLTPPRQHQKSNISKSEPPRREQCTITVIARS
jgi:hypothetical protein